MKLGLVGVGNMGRNHLRVMRENLDLEQDVLIYDPAHKDSLKYEEFLTPFMDLSA